MKNSVKKKKKKEFCLVKLRRKLLNPLEFVSEILQKRKLAVIRSMENF